MDLQWITTPFEAHDNVLWNFMKTNLIDEKIYDKGDALPFSDKAKKFRLRLSDCFLEVRILVNDIDWIAFNGAVSTNGILDFYVLPKLGKNEIKVVSLDGGLLYKSLNFNCYNMSIFMAFMAKRLKTLWNSTYQALANTYISDNRVVNMDAEPLVPEYKFTRSFATLLGTKRYSGLTNSQYYTFLQSVVNMNANGATYEGYYELQNALPAYIDRVDIIPLEKYLVQENTLYNKVFVDTTSNTKLRVYPNYIWQDINEWGILPNISEVPDATTNPVFYVYTDGELYSDTTNRGSLKLKYTNDAEFFKREFQTTDIFYNYDFRTDTTDGNVTGFAGTKYVVLRNPAIDGTIAVDTTGRISVNSSAIFLDEPDYNFVDLGTAYEDEIDVVRISYKTYDTPNIMAKVEKDSTTGVITNILMSGHPADSTSSTEKNLVADIGDKYYLSYNEDNFGSVVLVLRVKQKIDDELKDIINVIVRNTLPLHLRYYLVFSTVNLWNWWSDTHFTFSDTTSQPEWTSITFGDLK